MISQHLHSAARHARTIGRTLLMSLFLVACGGGVESGGTGGNATASYVSGPITGFGSVIVGGVRFDDSTAAVSDADGGSRSRDDLKLGMTINVRGTPIAGDGSSSATSIVVGSAIVGPVSVINVGAATLTVLGQPVDVLATTVFDESLGGGIAALSIGDVIEVYALLDTATQRYSATRTPTARPAVPSGKLACAAFTATPSTLKTALEVKALISPSMRTSSKSRGVVTPVPSRSASRRPGTGPVRRTARTMLPVARLAGTSLPASCA